MSKAYIDVTIGCAYPIAMAGTPFTLRIDTDKRMALESLSALEGRSMNQLVNEAIRGYLNRKGRKESVLEENLAALRAYRKSDPGFTSAITAFVDAESTLEDPLEGSVVEGKFAEQPRGPVQSKVRELLRA